MDRTQCVLAFLSLYAGLAHSFSWEIVTRTYDRLEFYDINGTLTHAEDVSLCGTIDTIIYDPLHNRVLFADSNNIYGFKIATKTLETLVTVTNSSITVLAYDPVTELVFWNEDFDSLFSISLKPGFNGKVNEKQFILMEDNVRDMTVDICGGYIHWMSGDLNVHRAHFNGSDKEVVLGTGVVSWDFINIDQQTQKIYWYKSSFNSTTTWGSIKCADLNGNNTRNVHQVLRPKLFIERQQLTFTKDHIYWKICHNDDMNCSIWKIPKNASNDTDLLVESNLLIERDYFFYAIAAKYGIEDLTREVKNCVGLENLLPSNTVNNNSSDENLLCVNTTVCEYAQGHKR